MRSPMGRWRRRKAMTTSWKIEGHVAARSRFKKVLSFVVTNYHVIDKCVGEIRGNLTGLARVAPGKYDLNISRAKDRVLAQAVREVAANPPSKCPGKRGSFSAAASPIRYSERAATRRQPCYRRPVGL
jgi:hypothetical protein